MGLIEKIKSKMEVGNEMSTQLKTDIAKAIKSIKEIIKALQGNGFESCRIYHPENSDKLDAPISLIKIDSNGDTTFRWPVDDCKNKNMDTIKLPYLSYFLKNAEFNKVKTIFKILSDENSHFTFY